MDERTGDTIFTQGTDGGWESVSQGCQGSGRYHRVGEGYVALYENRRGGGPGSGDSSLVFEMKGKRVGRIHGVLEGNVKDSAQWSGAMVWERDVQSTTGATDEVDWAIRVTEAWITE